jgi:hypothetical protein
MNPRLLEIQKEEQEQHLVIEQAIARLRALSSEEEEILMGAVRIESPNISMFRGTTRSLLEEFLRAKQMKLSKDDIWEDVMFRDANEEVDKCGAIRSVVSRARNEMKARPDFHYEIENIRDQGYRLVGKEVCQSVSKTSKTLKKAKK